MSQFAFELVSSVLHFENFLNSKDKLFKSLRERLGGRMGEGGWVEEYVKPLFFYFVFVEYLLDQRALLFCILYFPFWPQRAGHSFCKRGGRNKR